MKISRLVPMLLASLLVSVSAFAQSSLSVSFTTTSAGGNYSPANVVAVWVETSNGTFVKTVGRWAGQRKNHLVAWYGKSGASDTDAVSGATRSNHNGTLTKTWNLTNKSGAVVPDGTYNLKLELADSNTSTTAPNHEATFTFVKGTTSSTMTSNLNGFNNVTVAFNYVGSGTGGGTATGGGSATGGGTATTGGGTATTGGGTATTGGGTATTGGGTATSGGGSATGGGDVGGGSATGGGDVGGGSATGGGAGTGGSSATGGSSGTGGSLGTGGGGGSVPAQGCSVADSGSSAGLLLGVLLIGLRRRQNR